LAISEGAALVMLFAGVYPERTNGLILYAPLISEHLNRSIMRLPLSEKAGQRFQALWGTGVVLGRCAPTAASTPEGLAYIGRFERHGCQRRAKVDPLLPIED